MLTAVLHGKAGRVDIDAQVLSWRELFRAREDLLTSAFFGRLHYLSEPAQACAMALLVGRPLSDSLGALQDIQFWPRLKGLEDRHYVEPDVVLHFDKHLVLVEVKPPFGNDQHKGQWRAEIQALELQNEERKAIIFLALGRNVPTWKSDAAELESALSNIDLRVVTQEWQALKDGLSEVSQSRDARDNRIVADWMEAFRLYGLKDRPEPFATLLPLCRDSGADAALDLLRKPPKSTQWSPLISLAIEFEKDDTPWIFLTKNR
ncbi:hypothetical protein [Pseudomonas sp. PS01297]|uniref:hypothetical protein n=1 Tax=Pseudomonas sp. PS01297 TaxID=2991433 RepID=UPI00249B2FBF|nr:hypothetical protein [Pseudomonas sp. PS01297]